MKANLKSTAAALGLLALGMAPAFAADAVMEEPPAPAAPMEQPPLNTWSGPYAGVTLGYGFSGQTDVGDPALEIDTDGFLAHGFAGYQMESRTVSSTVSKPISATVATRATTLVSSRRPTSMVRSAPASALP